MNFLYDDALYDALSESERAIVPAEARVRRKGAPLEGWGLLRRPGHTVVVGMVLGFRVYTVQSDRQHSFLTVILFRPQNQPQRVDHWRQSFPGNVCPFGNP